MTDILLVGSSGCMRELAWQIIESNKISEDWNIIGYVGEDTENQSDEVAVSGKVIPLWGNDEKLIDYQHDVNVVVSVGNPALREKLVNKYKVNGKVHFPNIILRSASMCEDVKIGEGCILSKGAIVSTNVRMGDFVFVNMNGTICHDSQVGDFVSINPSATLAGNVTVGDLCEIGMGANVIQGIKIGSKVVIGAGSAIIKDTEDNCTVVGVPGRTVKG